MLAEQLARELGVDAEPGAVVVRNPPSIGGAEVVVRVIAGDPDDGDDRLVRAADAVGTRSSSSSSGRRRTGARRSSSRRSSSSVGQGKGFP